MSRKAVVSAAAFVAAAVVVLIAIVLPPSSGRALPAPPQTISVQATFTPAAVEFGDVVTVRVAVTLAAKAVHVSTLHVVYGVAPLTQLGQVVERHAARGGTRVATYELHAACLGDACLAASGRRLVSPHAVRAEVDRRDGTRATATAAWAPLTVAGRVSAADLGAARLPFRATTTPPPVSYRVRPAVLAALLDGAAALLAACGVALATSTLLRARRRQTAEARGDELARALELARAARTRPERDRRTAAGYVARLLRRRGTPLAGPAGDLAWSRPSPTPDALTELVESVEQERRT